MQLLEPGFAPVDVGPSDRFEVARLPVEADPAITAAIDRAIGLVGWQSRDVAVPGWDEALTGAGLLLVVEAWHSDRALVEEDPDEVGEGVRSRLLFGSACSDEVVRAAWETQRRWAATLDRVFAEVDFVVTPTLTIFPPPLEEGDDLLVARCTLPVNLAGVPALSLPVPTGGPLPASLQLIGPLHSEERLLAAGALLEAGVAGG